MTNGTRYHAERVADRLGVHDHFEDIFDIVAADLMPKPHAEVYDKFHARHGIDPTRAVMFEDLARNLEVPARLGVTTVLVVPEGTREVFREDWEMEGANAPHVHFVTDHLAAFLEEILAATGAA
jgi:putative hydrolase of the HAD superfamily